MSNLIPPLLSNSPPPPPSPDEDDEDEFGNFTGASGFSYGCDHLSLPSSPVHSIKNPIEESIPIEHLDINSNSKENGILSKNDEISLPKCLNNEQTISKGSSKYLADLEYSKKEEEYNPKNTQDVVTLDTKNDETEQFNEEFSDYTQIYENNILENSEQVQSIKKEEVSGEKLEDISNETEKEEATNEVSDDFDVFQFKSEKISPKEEVEEDDDFGDFSSCGLDSNRACEENREIEEEKTNDEDNNSDFGDFEVPKNIPEDDFGDFSSCELDSNRACDIVFPEKTCEGIEEEKNDDDDDNNSDFGDFEVPKNIPEDDFGDFSCSDHPTISIEINEKDAFEKTAAILKEIFPSPDATFRDYQCVNIEKNDYLFNRLKDVTETKALSYQWSKSSSQNMMLKALSIDARNILYGPAWNPQMPRFAANLGLTPLEPVKSEILPVQLTEPGQAEIPSAQFDWNGSGLVNPLDFSHTVLLDLQQFVVTLDIPLGNTNSSSNNSTSPITEPYDWDVWLQSPSPEETETSSRDVIITHQFDLNQLTKTNDDKRETDTKIDEKTTDTFLPPFKQHVSPWHNVVLRETHISDNNSTDLTNINNTIDLDWLQPTVVTPELPRKNVIVDDNDDDFDDYQMVTVATVSKPFEEVVVDVSPPLKPDFNIQSQEKVDLTNDDDEFTDFHCSVPAVVKPLEPTPVLEPLKPSVVYPTQQTSQISWPDPGLTEDDIKNFQINYSRVQNKSDENEWSDFVSVKNSSPVRKITSEKERSSTPDLPLSVLNLTSVRPAKKPVPLITPQGLMQTTLSTNMSLGNITGVIPNKTTFHPQHNSPSIISEQFANGWSNQHKKDDDEWSDFVSHQATPQPVGNWSNANIITNPGSCDVLTNKRPRTNTLNSISIPELDFIAPKNRNTIRK